MARKTTTFPIDGREGQIELRELSVKEIINIMQDESGNSMSDFKVLISKFLPKCSNLQKIEDLYDFTPSEIETIWEKFKEVNSVFLKVSQQMGLHKLLGDFREKLIEAVTEDFSELLVDSLKKDIPKLSTTDTPSS